ncbi:hypothetical protein KIH87_03360 [Paraneptunicella aestuarii]|uniref:hypothetical protein n=1 Tax=Paraneptunicella aestuarii TaxID=2831148 RepID=UPI001E54DA77|nr:hypothetical protein [Paraneptunicella aestuarii]UAA39409.1 hypothetical protein KIH87_03360 [Paraneptunicella aestuarii]
MSNQYQHGLAIEDMQTTQISQESDNIDSTFSKLAGKVNLIGATFSTAIDVMQAFGSVMQTEVIEQLNVLSDTVGLSMDSMSTWSYAASTLGVSSSDLGAIFQDMNSKMGELSATGGGKAKALFNELNLSIDEFKKLAPEQQMLAFADSVEQLGSHGEKVHFMESFAQGSSKLLPLLESGAEGLNKMARESKLLGFSLNDIDAEKVEGAAESFRILGGVTDGFTQQFTAKFSTVFHGMGEQLLGFLEQFGGMESIASSVSNFVVQAIGFVIDAFHQLSIVAKFIEIGWLSLGDIAARVIADQADLISQLIEGPLDHLTDFIGFIMDGWGQLFEAIGDFLGASGERFSNFGAKLRETSYEVANFNISSEDIVAGQQAVADKLAKSTEELQAMRKSAPGKEFVERVEAANSALEAQSDTTEKLAEANDKAQKNINKAAETTDALTQSNKDLKTHLESTTAATEEQAKQADKYTEAWEGAVASISTAFSEGWLDIIEGNASDVFGNIADSFKNMFKEMLNSNISSSIKGFFQNAFGDLGSIFSGGSGGGFNLGSLLGSFGGGSGGGFDIGSLFSMGDMLFGSGIGGSIMGIGNTIAGFGSSLGLSSLGAFGSGIGSTGAILGTQGVFGGFGTALGNVGSIFGSGSIMGGIGAALPIVGLVAGAAQLVDSISGGKLFGTSWKYDDHGINLDYSNGEFSGNNYSTQVKQRSLFRGRKWRTEETPLDAAVADQMNNYFSGIENLITGAASQLGITEVTKTVSSGFSNEDYDRGGNRFGNRFKEWFSNLPDSHTTTESLEDYLANFSSSFDLSLKDKSDEEAQQAIQAWADKATTELIDGVFGDMLDGMSLEGEKLADTLGRVMAQLSLVDQGFNSINLSLEQLAASAGVSELAYSNDVAQAAGGADRLAALLQGYQANFFSEEELLSRTLESMADQVKTALDSIGFTYGNDFRAEFEAASTTGLGAEDVVAWLEAGNLIGQFEEIAQQLADITGVALSEVTSDLINNADVITAEATQEEQAAAVSDPIVAEVSGLAETINMQVGSSNEHLVSIDTRLGEVNTSINSTLVAFSDEVKGIKLNLEGAIAETQRQVQLFANKAAAEASRTTALVSDVARLVAERATYYRPVIDDRALL